MFKSSKTDSKKKYAFTVRLKTLTGLFIALLIWQAGSALILPKASLEASDITPENILSAISRERMQKGLNGLNTDNRLVVAAQYKADDMMNRRYFSHTDPEGNFIWNKIVEAGYTPYLQLGENLAIEFYNTESLVSAWMNSPTHRANILNEGFKDQGMGVAFGNPNQGKYYSAIANTFGTLVLQKKLPMPSPFPISPEKPVPAPAPSPTPITGPKQTPKTQEYNAEAKTGAQEPIKVSVAQTSPPKEKLRAQDYPQNFALPEQKGPTGSGVPVGLKSSEPLRPGSAGQESLNAYNINRYLMLGFASILVLLAVSDLKKILEEKIRTYDKKISNLVLLVLSLIVIGLMYWL
ncbi:MAG: hypothetical protein HYZ51_00175 [Candidatus Doudnabacteria bacterium]|nr:hypothetical protein [Candidatus Doudnabacteria bacterium]